MKHRLMDFIHCPDCKEDFVLNVDEQQGEEIISGTIECPGCKARYFIIKGILRFLKDINSEEDLRAVYADSFGQQWTTYNWLRDEDEKEFSTITDLSKEDLSQKVILDIGCGGGRFSRIVSRYCREFVGFDYSIAVEKAYELCKDVPSAHFLQCDVNYHPLKPCMFDFAYSHGVIHHTSNTKKSFDNLPGLVKEGGLFYIAVFRQSFILLRWSDSFWRLILNKLPYGALDKVCGALSYLKYLPFPIFFKRFFWFSLQPTKELRKYCLFDWYGPKYHHEHTVQEVMGWFEEAGYEKIKYINAWPYCPPEEKYAIPGFFDSFRLGQLLGVIGTRKKT
ncbi:MAG: methyltransferase domain-containing protein [Chloroflexi bacterium]|nr:methyltransferase domain-containing protein [Chloroflexota bacterium]